MEKNMEELNDFKVGDKVKIILKSEKKIFWDSEGEMLKTIDTISEVKMVGLDWIHLENKWFYDRECLTKNLKYKTKEPKWKKIWKE